MADTFNPYHKWLGIPPKDQPPNLYRLLGVDLFEADADVISAAADQRMVFLRSFRASKQGDIAEALLNEIAGARVCLLMPEKREAYDHKLRAKLSPLPVPHPLTPAAVTQEFARTQQRSAAADLAGDTGPLRTTDTQEVKLATAPLPAKATVPPPARKSGPLPMAAYAATNPQAFDKPTSFEKPPPRSAPPPLPVAEKSHRSADASLKPPATAPWLSAALLAELPLRLWSASLFLIRLPGVITLWLLSTSDNALLRMVGEENRILHNFLRVVAPAVLMSVVIVGGLLGGSWALPHVVAAIRARAVAKARRY